MPCHIIILGAGISGLSYAWYLKKKFKSAIRITILEKESHVGGWIQTKRRGGFLFEQGPHSIRMKGHGMHTLELVEELGLQDQLILADPAAKIRYLYANQKLQKMPSHLFSTLFSSVGKDLLKASLNDFFGHQKALFEETVFEFFSRKLGPILTERMIDPLISGIYAGDMRKLSFKSCFPQIYALENKFGSICRGLLFHKQEKAPLTDFMKKGQKTSLFSFKNGMHTLPQAFEKNLDADIQLNREPTALSFEKDCIAIHLKNQKKIEADYVISTIPSYAVGNLLKISDFQKIPYASVSVVHLGYRQDVLKRKGFGYLIPHQERESILGCIWDSSVFPQQNQNLSETRLTVMMGGMQQTTIEHLSEQQCQEVALGSIEKHLGITQKPEVIHVSKAIKAIPQYEVGYELLHNRLTKEIKNLSPRLFLGGQAFNGISVNDAIYSAKEWVKNFNPLLV